MQAQLEFEFVKELKLKKTSKEEDNKNYEEIAHEASERFHAFMDHYKVPNDVREEIKSLASWF